MIITDFIYYDLKVAVLIAVFYLFYQLLLARENMHTLNRAVLLSAIGLSLVLPLCVVTIHVAAPQAPLGNGEGITAPEILAAQTSDTPETNLAPLPWGRIGSGLLAVILMAGIVVRLFIVARNCWKLHRLIANGERLSLPSGTRVCVVDAPVAPFSWMHTVVLSRAEWESLPLERECSPVLAHEEAHVRHRHSYDVLVVEVLTALQWFNPVVWFLRQELRTLHEYDADASVLSEGFDESQYIHLLMLKATGIQACALANGINTHRTKKRIFMMLKPKSNRTAWLKALYVVPIVLVSLTMTAKTVIDYETTEADNYAAIRIVNEKTNGRGESYQIRHAAGVKFYNNGKEEAIPGDRPIALEVKKTTMQLNGVRFDENSIPNLSATALREIHLNKTGEDRFVCNLVTEEPMRYSSKMSDAEFVIYVKKQQAAGIDENALGQIMLNEAGSVSRAHILHVIRAYGSNKNKLLIVDGKEVSLEEFNQIKPEAIASVTVMDVGPAKKAFGEKGRYGATIIETKGKTAYIVDGELSSEEAVGNIDKENIASVSVISSGENIRKAYELDADKVVVVQTKEQGDDPVFDICEQLPRFPGGEAKMMEFIARNIKYPAKATEYGVTGRVIVKFIVEKDGSLSHVEVAKTTGFDEPSETATAATVVGYGMTEQEQKDADAQAEGLRSGKQALIDEAVRMVKSMPKWSPGKQNGEAVRCRYSIPVTYRLQ